MLHGTVGELLETEGADPQKDLVQLSISQWATGPQVPFGLFLIRSVLVRVVRVPFGLLLLVRLVPVQVAQVPIHVVRVHPAVGRLTPS